MALCLLMLAVACVPASGGAATAASAAGFSVPGNCSFNVDGEYVKNVELGTTVGEFLYFWNGASMKDINGKTLSAGDVVGTGATLTVGGSTVTVIVNGDADGDGVSTSADAAIAKSLLMNSGDSTKYGFIASELTGDGVITTADYLKLKHAKDCGLLVQSAPSTVKVPNLVGQTEAAAKEALQRLGLSPDVRYTTQGTAGQVVYQKTAPGATAGEGAKICFAVAADNSKYTPLNYESMKGIWLHQYTASTSLFKNGSKQRDESSYRQLVQRVASNMSKDGFNTVFLQVRPYGDSLYPSSVYPPSPYATSVSSGYNGTFTYDPLEVFIEEAHKKGISVHAWLNPMRLMTSMTTISKNYRLGQWYADSSKNGEYIVYYNGRYYLNPAYPEARQLVVDGCMEICENYDIDGIHFDDYFYIDISDTNKDLAFDQGAFDKYGSGWGSSSSLSVRKEWRRNNVNTLLKEIFSAIKAYDSRILFGVSPAGNIDNNQTGYLCADVRTWCSTPGYIDYIAPQVYWSFSWKSSSGATFAAFDKCCNSWSNLVTCKDVRLIIGIGIYRATEGYSSTDPDWYNKKDNVKRMLEYTKQMDKCTGWIMFKYENIYNILSSGYSTQMTEELNNFLPLVPTW